MTSVCETNLGPYKRRLLFLSNLSQIRRVINSHRITVADTPNIINVAFIETYCYESAADFDSSAEIDDTPTIATLCDKRGDFCHRVIYESNALTSYESY